MSLTEPDDLIFVRMVTAAIMFGLYVPTPARGIDASTSNKPFERNRHIEMPDRGVAAHRGSSRTHPENTMPAIRAAIQSGVHQLEVDVLLTKDKVPVLMHDHDVSRTTNGTGSVGSLTLAQIKKLDAGSYFSPFFAGVRVPTLEELFRMMPSNVWINLDCKADDEELGRVVAQIIIRDGREHQAFLAATPATVRGARSVDSRILICNMEAPQRHSQEYVDSTIRQHMHFIQLRGFGPRDWPEDSRAAMPTRIAQLKKAGVRINCRVRTTPDGLEKLWSSGVDFVMIDYVEPQMKLAEINGISRWIPKWSLHVN